LMKFAMRMPSPAALQWTDCGQPGKQLLSINYRISSHIDA
jgi:hypothetical protein